MIIGIILAPIDLTLLFFKANARQLFFWARNVQVIYVPPGGDFPDGPLPRRSPFPPVEPDPDSLLEQWQPMTGDEDNSMPPIAE